jgi:RES domain-containing protein
VKFSARHERLLDALLSGASPLVGTFYRSVEFRWMHPDDVASGAGTARLGGRFAPSGTRAVYASDSEETVLREISIRKQRLSGKAQIDLDRYPRVTFRLQIKLKRHVDLTGPFPNADLEI